METTFTWEIRVKNCPLLIKKCSHCDSDRFYCSDKFRMNAQAEAASAADAVNITTAADSDADAISSGSF